MSDHDTIVVLDYGSQTTQLIARRVREAGVYSAYFTWNADPEAVKAVNPKGIILSGSPHSAYEPGAPTLLDYVLELGVPVLGICYGMQVMTHTLGGKVAHSAEREYGPADIRRAPMGQPARSPERVDEPRRPDRGCAARIRIHRAVG